MTSQTIHERMDKLRATERQKFSYSLPCKRASSFATGNV